MLQIHLVKPSELTPADWDRWNALQLAGVDLESPYFRPEFTQAVAAVRTDVEIAVLEQGGETVGFFPFQRGALNIGKPVGGKLSDYHGVIGRSDVTIDAMHLLRACRLAGWDFDHLPASQTTFASHVRESAPSRWIDLTDGASAWEAARRASGTEAMKKGHQKLRRLERELGTLRFTPHVADDKLLDQLIAWKSAQYVRTGLTDIFQFPWTVRLLRNMLAQPQPLFALELSALWSGDRLAAVMASLRSRHVVHSWFPAYEPELSDFTPGIGLYLKLAECSAERQFTRIDLGKGEERYKLQLSTPGTLLATGTVERSSLGIWLRRGWRTTKQWLEPASAEQAAAGARWLQPVRSWLAMR